MKTFTPKDRSEVELRVSQELKNNQDFIYQTNQAIQNLNQSIVSLSLLMEKMIAKTRSDRQEVLIGFENFKELVSKQCNQFCQRIGDLESNYLALQEDLMERMEDISFDYITKDDFVSRSLPEWRRLDVLEREHKQQKDYFSIAVDQLREHARQQCEQVKKDLTPEPKEDPIKKFLEERLTAFKVDCEGLVREIALLKKAVAYDQKKFENIYTLIERLKEGIQ